MLQRLVLNVMRMLKRQGILVESSQSSPDSAKLNGYFKHMQISVKITVTVIGYSYAQNLGGNMSNQDRTDLFIDRLTQTAFRICEGNNEATTLIHAIIEKGPLIHPYDGLNGLGVLQVMAKLGLHADEIMYLYTYVCREKLTRLIALLHAVTIGYLHERDIYRYLYAALMGEAQLKELYYELPDTEILYDWIKSRLYEFDAHEAA